MIEQAKTPKECPKCGNKHLFGVEYGYNSPYRYDGVSEWWCNPQAGGCGWRMGRWTGRELTDPDEVEPPYGDMERLEAG